jgi:hypothetical protein
MQFLVKEYKIVRKWLHGFRDDVEYEILMST